MIDGEKKPSKKKAVTLGVIASLLSGSAGGGVVFYKVSDHDSEIKKLRKQTMMILMWVSAIGQERGIPAPTLPDGE